MSTTSPDKEPMQQQPPAAAEFEPPLACVRRILKNSLPSSTNVGKDASAAFARACGIFIIYLTACANDFAREHKRQTITANDVLAAIKELDFDDFTGDMMTFLESYRATEKEKKDAKAKALAKKAEEEEAAATSSSPTIKQQAEDEDHDEAEEEAKENTEEENERKRSKEEVSEEVAGEDEPEAKRAKTEDTPAEAAAGDDAEEAKAENNDAE